MAGATDSIRTKILVEAGAVTGSFPLDGTILYYQDRDRHNRSVIALVSVDTGRRIEIPVPNEPATLCHELSPDNGTLALSDEFKNQVCLWDVRRGQWRTVLNYNIDYVSHMAFSPDSKMLALVLNTDRDVLVPNHKASGAAPVRIPNSYIVLFDAASGRLVRTLHSPDPDKQWAVKVSFSPDGRWVAGLGGVERKTRSGYKCVEFCDDYLMAVWEVRSGKPVWFSRKMVNRGFVGFASKADLLLTDGHYLDMRQYPWQLHEHNFDIPQSFYDPAGTQARVDDNMPGRRIVDIRSG